MASRKGNVFGAMDSAGEPFVVVSYQDTDGSHQFLLPTPVARQMAQALANEADAADELARRFAISAPAPAPEGPLS